MRILPQGTAVIAATEARGPKSDMPDADVAALTAPIDDESPCGPDLDLEDDDVFANFMSASEMVLPDRYFVEDHEGKRKPFYTDDRFKDLNLDTSIASATKLMSRTHDLRLLCLVAKIHIFNRRIGAFQVTVQAIAAVLETFWEEVHPRLETGLRDGVLERLNEQYTVVTALNNAPLLRSRRFGSVTWQSYLAAVREASGDREDADTSSVDRILVEECKSELASVASVQATFGLLGQAVTQIGAVCADKMGSQAPDLRRLSEAVVKIRAMLDRVNPPPAALDDTSDDAAASGPSGKESSASSGSLPFETTEAARHALAAATRYIAQAEPSSPALLLLRQAQALVGKSFMDVLDSLIPEQVRKATLSVAAFPIFSLPLRQLAEHGAASERSNSDRYSEDADPDDGTAPIVPRFQVGSRPEALALLERVGAHYRAVEPSSPIPLLIARARDLMGKDFMSLIRAMLPEAVLRDD